MAGLAKTTDFMLASATVMIGPVSEYYNLNPTDHSIGLVKNFVLTSEPAYTELTQGVKGDIVFSVQTANPVKATMETYEYTAKNIAYALGLESAAAMTPQTVVTAINGAITETSPLTDDIVVDSATGITIGNTILIEVNSTDDFVVRKVTNVTSNTLELNKGVGAIPDNAVVRVVNSIDVGSQDEQPFYAAKISGKLANGKTITIQLAKVRIMRGFNLGFSVEDYANMPFEFTVYQLVDTDTLYADFGAVPAKVYIA